METEFYRSILHLLPFHAQLMKIKDFCDAAFSKSICQDTFRPPLLLLPLSLSLRILPFSSESETRKADISKSTLTK